MFADVFTIKLGETTVKGRRLTLKELRDNHGVEMPVAKALELIKSHVTLADGSKFDPEELTPGQMRKLVGELILPEEGRGISDFIGLFS